MTTIKDIIYISKKPQRIFYTKVKKQKLLKIKRDETMTKKYVKHLSTSSIYKLTQLCVKIIVYASIITIIKQVNCQQIVSESKAIATITTPIFQMNSKNSQISTINKKFNNHYNRKKTSNLYTKSINNNKINTVMKHHSLIVLSNNNSYISDNTRIHYNKYHNVTKVSTIPAATFSNGVQNNNFHSENGTKMSDNIVGVDLKNSLKIGSEDDNHIDNIQFLKLVMDGLGMKTLPNMKMVNISQEEYASKYIEYLQRIQKKHTYDSETVAYEEAEWKSLHLLSIVTNSSRDISDKRQRQKRAMQLMPKPDSNRIRQMRRNNNNNDDTTNILLKFPLNVEAKQLQADDVEEANIRLMLIYSPALAVKRRNNRNKYNRNNITANNNNKFINSSARAICVNNVVSTTTQSTDGELQPIHTKEHKQHHVLNLKVFQLMRIGKRQWLDGHKIQYEIRHGSHFNSDETHSQWLQFDVTKAVESWLRARHTNLGLELQCDNCKRIGARILNDLSASASTTGERNDDNEHFKLMPVLNIISRLGVTHQEPREAQPSDNDRHRHHQNRPTAAGQRQSNSCYKPHQRCCRHTMEVVFKEIKGFEFIIQPKVFDAGYCHGRCPPRYNAAHHHALLQSLIWKQDHKRAPRPCCAPSKLVELEVLHIDEKDSEKLKISTWSDMQVIECACS